MVSGSQARAVISRAIATAAFVAAAPLATSAQQLRGTITDSATNRPVAGAVVMLADSAGSMLSRTVSNERGQYNLVVTAAARTLRVIRIGFRARERVIDETTRRSGRLDIAMVPIPPLLERMLVHSSSRCPRRDDTPQALSLLEQARAGLLSTIVARESRPAEMKLLAFERTMDGASERIVSQKVKIDSSGNQKQSFMAVSRDFLTHGFSQDSSGVRQFFGPDAETLLNEGFLAGYCVRIQSADRNRPNQVGLAFSPAERVRARVDIDGALWIDTVANTLRDFEFRYVGLDRIRGIREPGGHIWFREMPNGVVLIDRWHLVLYDARIDTVFSNRDPVERATYYNRETGGEIARAIWPDGVSWKGSLATLHLQVVDAAGRPAPHTILRFKDTDYIGSPNEKGELEFTDLLPGPYRAEFIDATAPLGGVVIGTSVKIIAERDSLMRATFIAPPRREFQRRACGKQWVQVTVTRSDKPVAEARWEIGVDLESRDPFVVLSGVADADGIFGFCHQASLGAKTQLRVRSSIENTAGHLLHLDRFNGQSLAIKLPPGTTP